MAGAWIFGSSSAGFPGVLVGTELEQQGLELALIWDSGDTGSGSYPLCEPLKRIVLNYTIINVLLLPLSLLIPFIIFKRSHLAENNHLDVINCVICPFLNTFKINRVGVVQQVASLPTQLPAEVPKKPIENGPVLGSLLPTKKKFGLLFSAFLSQSCYKYLGCDTGDGKSLCHSAIPINKSFFF